MIFHGVFLLPLMELSLSGFVNSFRGQISCTYPCGRNNLGKKRPFGEGWRGKFIHHCDFHLFSSIASHQFCCLKKKCFLKVFSENGNSHYFDNVASHFTLRVNEFFRHSGNFAFCVSTVGHLPRLFWSLPSSGSCL